jgi:hypothetical protein
MHGRAANLQRKFATSPIAPHGLFALRAADKKNQNFTAKSKKLKKDNKFLSNPA